MTRNKKLAALSAIVAVGMITATAAMARPFFMGGQSSPEKMEKRLTWIVEDVMDDLDASDGQQAEVQSIVKRAFRDLAPMHKEKDAFREAMKAEFSKEDPNQRAISTLLDEKFVTARKAADRVTEAVLEIHTVLDADQRAQLMERMEKHRHGPFGH